MSELDDFDSLELDLSPRPEGSARRIRSGKKHAAQKRAAAFPKPKWRRQLGAERAEAAKDRDR